MPRKSWYLRNKLLPTAVLPGVYSEAEDFLSLVMLFFKLSDEVKIKSSSLMTEASCPGLESNQHTLWAADFESAASTNSATRANGLQYYSFPAN